jgi:hypothetical protein
LGFSLGVPEQPKDDRALLHLNFIKYREIAQEKMDGFLRSLKLTNNTKRELTKGNKHLGEEIKVTAPKELKKDYKRTLKQLKDKCSKVLSPGVLLDVD